MTSEARLTRPLPPAAAPIPAARPVKVVIVDTAIAFGGTLAVSRNLLKHLDPGRVDASLVSACADGFVSHGFAGETPVRLLAPRVSYVTLGKWKNALHRRLRRPLVRRGAQLIAMVAEMLANVPYRTRLILLYRKTRAEVVHVNNYTMEPLWAARFLGIPIVYHLHGFVSPEMDGSGRRNFRHVKAFVSISRAVTESALRAGIHPNQLHEIQNFVEQAPTGPPPPMPGTPAIGIFGRVTKWKGQREFLLAALEVLPKYPGLRVYIVGDASDTDPKYLDECRKIAQSSPFAAQIEFTGLVTDVAKYYKRCTAVIHASIDPEPFGMVLIEAMAQARPVVASIYGAAPEVIHDGIEGFLVDPRDTRAMAARICDLLSDPGRATEMGIKGYEKVRAQYTPQAAARKFERLYTELARSTAGTRQS